MAATKTANQNKASLEALRKLRSKNPELFKPKVKSKSTRKITRKTTKSKSSLTTDKEVKKEIKKKVRKAVKQVRKIQKQIKEKPVELKESVIKATNSMSIENILAIYANIEKFKSVPVTIDEFIENDYYLGKIYGGCNSNGEPIVYPFWREKLREVFPDPFHSPYEQVCVTGAIGIGKTTFGVIGALYDLYRLLLLIDPHDKYGIISTDRIVLALFTATKTLGGSVLETQITDIFVASPWFRERYKPNLKEGIMFPPKVGLTVGSRGGHTLGQAVAMAIIDEANFQQAVHNQFIDTYNNIVKRMKSRFMGDGGSLPYHLWLLSSKKSDAAPLEAIIEMKRNDPKVLVIETSLWAAHGHKNIYSGKTFKVFLGDDTKDPVILESDEIPGYMSDARVIDVPVEYRGDFTDDIMTSIQDIAGVSTVSGMKLFKSKEQLMQIMIVPMAFTKDVITLTEDEDDSLVDYMTDYLKDLKGKESPRFIHVDVAVNGDNLGLAMAHSAGQKRVERVNHESGRVEAMEEHVIKTDFAIGLKCKPGQEIPLFKVRAFILHLRAMGFIIQLVSTDGFESVEFKQLLRKQDFETELVSVDRTKDAYLSFRRAAKEGRALVPNNAKLREEFLDVEDVGKKIDHSLTGSKDISDAVVGCNFTCREASFSSQLYAHDLIKDMEKELITTSLFGREIR